MAQPPISAIEPAHKPNHEDWQAEYRAWIEGICTQHHVTPTEIARRIGASPSTITRQIKPGWTRRPQLDILRRISQAFQQPIPASLVGTAVAAPGLQEPDVAPINVAARDDGFDPNISRWQVRTPVLAGLGCMVGDVLEFDARIVPVAGDIVIAQVYKFGQTGADTVMRYVMPPFLVAAEAGRPTILPVEMDPTGERVVIMGTMTRRVAERQHAHKSAA